MADNNDAYLYVPNAHGREEYLKSQLRHEKMWSVYQCQYHGEVIPPKALQHMYADEHPRYHGHP